MTTPNQIDPLVFDRRYSIASIDATRERIAAALAISCTEHAADAGAYCWGSERIVRGLCRTRYENGTSQPSRNPTSAVDVPLTVASDARTRLEFRHPNRHPITPIRGAVAR